MQELIIDKNYIEIVLKYIEIKDIKLQYFS